MPENIPELFGSLVFNDETMHARLPKDIYRSLKKTIGEGRELDINVANAVATAMKDWAIEKGATHYTHWFQPNTGITAEKHDSFISPQENGKIIMEFSGKELIKGEPDASSFPSGGIRATFEARGYTAWDPTSYAFIKDDSLCIPTVFCSYTGEVLDKKTPLLRSVEELNKQALRLLHIIGRTDVNRVISTVGAEQEYFLVDKELYNKRPDLILTGRTLFGAKPPKGQELDDHYFGAIRPRVMSFMKDLNRELWKVGVLAKTEHNEVAPAQHELAPVFTVTNIATDQNQLTMEIMKKVADRHSLACLLHEKPFAGVNGSGKHNNWSLATDEGENLLKPGKNPKENKQFLLFLAAVLKAVDDYQDLLRISVSNPGNDHRLGANEAPPAVISAFVGDDIEEVINAVIDDDSSFEKRNRVAMETGVDTLPSFMRDTTDRNRTSPFAFTGNKFEFRMPGSSVSIADTNIVINTIAAESLSNFSDELNGKEDMNSAVDELIRRTFKEHKRIIFNGNGYDNAWIEEAERRGLLNYRTSADAIPHLTDEKNVELFSRHKIFTRVELEARREIMLENYCKVLNIEALTMIDMAKKDILPSAFDYIKSLSETAKLKKSIGIDISDDACVRTAQKLTMLTNCAYRRIESLNDVVIGAHDIEDYEEKANYFKTQVLPAMQELRAVADEIETDMASEYLPYPNYSKLLFSV
mgnify:FL=1